MIGTVDVRCNAAKPNFPLQPMFAFMGSPSSIRILDVPKSIGEWEITSVRVAVLYPNNLTIEKTAVRTGSVWVSTIEGCEVAGKVGNGYQILADGVDEDGNDVTGYVLGKGDVFILDNDSDVKKLLEKYTVRYLDEVPAAPSVGDILNINGQVRLFDGERWLYISNGGEPTVVYDSEIKIKKNGTEVGSFTTNSETPVDIDIPVPSKASDLVNDVGFITESAIPSNVGAFTNDVGYLTSVSWGAVLDKPDVALMSDIPSNVSELDNDEGFITAEALPSKVSELQNDVGYLSAVTWNDVSDKPNIPSKTSDLDNDSGFITASAIPSNVGAFENDVGYITASQVEPATYVGYNGYAQNAHNAARMYNRGETGSFVDETTFLKYTEGKLNTVSTKYYPWSLSYYNGTTFDPPYELVFEYRSQAVFMFRPGRFQTVNINSYCWIYNPNTTTLYFIPCDKNGVPTGTMGIGISSYPITISQDGLSIETINGQSGNITCTRTSTGYTQQRRYVAFEDQVPSAVSQLTNDVGYLTTSSSAFTAKRDKSDLVYKVGFDKDSLDKVVKFVVEYVDGNNQNATATLDKYDDFTQTWTGDNTNWRVYTYLAGMEAELYFALDDGTAGQDAQPAPSQGAEDTSWNFTYNSNQATWTMVMTQNIALQQDFKNLRDMKDISYPASVDSTGMYTIQKFNVNGKDVAHFTASGSTSTWDTNDPVMNQYEISTTDGTNFTMVSNGIQLGTFTMTSLKNGVVDVTYDGSTYTVGATFKQTTFALKDYVDQQIGSVLTEQM